MPDADNILYKYCLKTKGEFNIMTSIPLDAMHTVFHCALNGLIEDVWIKGKQRKDGKVVGKFTPILLKSLELKLAKVKGCLPYAIQAAALGTKKLEKIGQNWSCTERRIFILYVAIVIFRDPLMDEGAYKVILSLQHALLLLAGQRHLSSVPERFLVKAQENLLYVVEKCQEMYGLDFPKYTFHCLLHIVQDLKANHCRLEYCSMFKYENSMRYFVHALGARSGARVHAQIRNSLLRKKLSNVVLPPQ